MKLFNQYLLLVYLFVLCSLIFADFNVGSFSRILVKVPCNQPPTLWLTDQVFKDKQRQANMKTFYPTITCYSSSSKIVECKRQLHLNVFFRMLTHFTLYSCLIKFTFSNLTIFQFKLEKLASHDFSENTTK